MVDIIIKKSQVKMERNTMLSLMGKRQFHSELLDILILPNIKTRNVKRTIQQGTNLIKTGRTIQLPVSGLKIFSGVSLPLKLP